MRVLLFILPFVPLLYPLLLTLLHVRLLLFSINTQYFFIIIYYCFSNCTIKMSAISAENLLIVSAGLYLIFDLFTFCVLYSLLFCYRSNSGLFKYFDIGIMPNMTTA